MGSKKKARRRQTLEGTSANCAAHAAADKLGHAQSVCTKRTTEKGLAQVEQHPPRCHATLLFRQVSECSHNLPLRAVPYVTHPGLVFGCLQSHPVVAGGQVCDVILEGRLCLREPTEVHLETSPTQSFGESPIFGNSTIRSASVARTHTHTIDTFRKASNPRSSLSIMEDTKTEKELLKKKARHSPQGSWL